jgi:hypothetical protein
MRISYATADEVLVDALARIKKAADSKKGFSQENPFYAKCRLFRSFFSFN